MTRDIVKNRYSYLPYWYTLFYNYHTNGLPIIRPAFMEYPNEPSLYNDNDMFLVGKDILVRPITKEAEFEVE